MSFRLTYNKGDDPRINFDWDTSITGATVQFIAKLKATDPDGEAILDKDSTTGGVVITDGATGVGYVDMNETDWDQLGKAETELACSLRLVKAGRTTTETGIVTVVAVP